MSVSSRLRITLLSALTVGLLLLSASSTLAASAPAWTLRSTHGPTFFAPGDETDYYLLTITNSGAASTDGSTVTVTDSLPAGVTAVKLETSQIAGENSGFHGFSESGWSCAIGGQLVCTRSDVLAAGASYPTILLRVSVASGVSLGTVSNVATATGGGAGEGSTSDPTTITTGQPFGVSSFTTHAASTQAGAHPDLTTTLSFDTHQDPNHRASQEEANGGHREKAPSLAQGYFIPGGTGLQDIVLKLPRGLVGDRVPLCPRSRFLDGQDSELQFQCPADTQVGFGAFYVNSPILSNFNLPFGVTNLGYRVLYGAIYDLEPSEGEAVRLGITIDSPDGETLVQVAFTVGGAAEDYAVTATSSNVTHVFQSQDVLVDGFSLELWGVPADPSHDGFRRPCLTAGPNVTPQGLCPLPSGTPLQPFVENPTDCENPPVTSLRVDSYLEPGNFLEYSSQASGPSGQPIAASTGCGLVPFAPSLEAQPDTTKAGAPTGLNVDLKVPQDLEPQGIGTSSVKKVTVALPAGMSISPSAAAQALGGCTDAQLDVASNTPSACPADSVIGSVEVLTPALSGPLLGKVYLGQPLEQTDPASGEMYRLFMELQGFGIDVKVVGHVSADPVTGQLTATFAGLPELPFGDFKLAFRDGPNAVLSNPPTCGSYTTTSQLTPFSTGVAVEWPSSFTTSFDGNGAPCPPSQPFSPGVSVWGTSTQAGADSAVSFRLTRPDGQDYLSVVSAHLPPGLLGDVATVPLCPTANVAAGTCPSSSQVGVVAATVGPGSDPLELPGSVYLGRGFGPYPFALSVVVPAVAGPFNLGNVTVRVGILVNNDGSITAQSDPLPQIIDGIPVGLRGVTLTLDRPGFTFNPTSCAAMSLTSTLTSITGATASPSAPFQVGGCGYLPFKPAFLVSSSGHTSRAGGASLAVHVAQTPGQANIHSVRVELPKQLPARLTTLQKACPEGVFDANPAACDPGSVVGSAVAHSPLLSSPVQGPAYFVSHGGAKFPELILVLQGEGVTIDLPGETFISKAGVTSSTFKAVPDVPITSFDLTLPEGPYSALAANGNLCATKLVMPTTIEGQNGSKLTQNTKITVTGCKATKTKAQTRAQKLTKALKACKTKYKKSKKKRAACEKQARTKYGPIHKAKKANRRGK